MKEKPVKPPKNLTGKSIATPNGKIRPGNRKPFRKATLEEQAEIIDFVAKLLVRQASKFEIHKAVETKFGKSWQQTDVVYLTRAREQVRKAASITKDQAREIGLGVLLDVVKTEKGNVRVNAERRLSEIFGYNAPTRTELTGADGGPIATKEENPLAGASIERLRELASLDMSRNGH